MWKEMETVGKTGSEEGIIIRDEEYKRSCCITLEKCAGYYAITCGVYGGMVHTTFAEEDNFQQKYDNMKGDLQTFIDGFTNGMCEEKFYEEFTSKY